MKISDLLNLTAPDVQSWTAEDYRAALRPLRAEAGKRVANLRKSGTLETSPAADWYQRNLKNIAKSDISDFGKLKQEFINTQSFLNAKTSRVKYAMQTKAKIDNIFKGVNKTPTGTGESFESRVYRLFRQFSERHYVDKTRESEYLREIAKMAGEGLSDEEILKRLEKLDEEFYEETAENANDDWDFEDEDEYD